MKRLIISTVGTSLFTNRATDTERKTIIRHSNTNEENAPAELKTGIERISETVREEFNKASIKEIRRISAELNGILGIYNNSFDIPKGDFHYLIATDTYPGKKAGELLATLLSDKGLTADSYTPKGFSTLNKDTFSSGIKDLLKFFESVIPSYKEDKYEVIFNLTGSFKSLQGYLNTIAMFYADRIIYIFESELAELIEIPRLPVKIDTAPFSENKETLLLLSQNKIVKKAELKDFPETMLDIIDNEVILSVWGELVWSNIKEELFKELPELPKIKYSDTFRKNFKEILNSKERIKLLEVLAKSSVILEEDKGSTERLKRDGGILYEDYMNKTDNGVKIGHFRVTQGIRVSCQSIDGILYLRKYGKEPVVNNNP